MHAPLLLLSSLARMELLGPLRLFLTLLALATPLTITSAQAASALDPVGGMISGGQPIGDNVLLFPLSGQLSKETIDGLLVPSKLWSRKQEATCATKYALCRGTQFCCPDGNVCCSGEFLSAPGQNTCGGDVDDGSFWYVSGGTCCGAGYEFRLQMMLA